MSHSSSPHSISPLSKIPLENDNLNILSPEELAEQRSQWLSRLLSENPQLLALRERVLPWTGGYSFSNVVHTNTTAVLSHINRHVILELVYQHLNSIGMHRTAETLQKESGHEFQLTDQPWDKTDLLLLTSLGILPREDPWTISPDPNHQFVEENLEEDFFAFPYREDPKLIWQELLNDSLNVVYSIENNRNFSKIKCASLKRLIVLLATSTIDTLTDDDIYKFFLTLHSITSSHHFFEHLCSLFYCQNLEPNNIEEKNKILLMEENLKVNVINLIKKWTNFHGLFIGRKTLKSIEQFLRKINDDINQKSNLEKFVKPVLTQLPNLSFGMKSGVLPPPSTKPNIPDPQIIFKPNLKLIEPDPIEVARQITLIFHTAFKAVHSREFVVALGEQKASHQTPTLSEFFDFGERLTLLTLETVVISNDKILAITKFLEIASALYDLGNYDALACILRALKRNELDIELIFSNNSNNKLILNQLWSKCGDDNSNIELYSSNVMQRYEGWNATIPNLRTELNSVTLDKSQSFINGLINWEKRKGISEKTAVLYRFQNKPYSYTPIPQIQNVVNKGPLLSQKQIDEKLDLIYRS